jgi:receptor-type tyrosine-protein phosphatase A
MSVLTYKSDKPTNVANTYPQFNRYYNIKPFDDNLVELSTEEYINASWIFDKKCIATQGPMRNTIKQFWRMVVDSGSALIIMLTQLYENNMEKCCCYWLDEGVHQTFDGIDVKLLGTTSVDNIILRVFVVNNKIVNHIQYLDWSDSAIPSNPEDIYKIITVIDNLKGNSPFIIHCSAGVGRTGVILTLYHKYHNPLMDIDDIIYTMRNQRPNMVQNMTQYEFIQKIVKYKN